MRSLFSNRLIPPRTTTSAAEAISMRLTVRFTSQVISTCREIAAMIVAIAICIPPSQYATANAIRGKKSTTACINGMSLWKR